MFREFLDWLEVCLNRVGLRGLVEGILGILGFGVLLSGLLGIQAIRSAFVAAVVMAVLGGIVLAFIDRSYAYRRNCLERRLLAKYCDVLLARAGQQWRIVRWEESSVVKDNGDTNERIVVTAIVESEFLDFFAIRSGAGWSQPNRARRRVKIGVVSFEGEGLRSSAWDVTSTWLDDGRAELVIHFAESMRRGALIKMTVDKEWPGKCAPLMKDRRPDEFALRFSCPIDYIEYSIVLPAGCDAHCDAIGLRDGVDDYALGLRPLGREQVEARLVARGIPARQRVGMVLCLKGSRGTLRRVS
jgi:hypothetical protein